MNTRPLNLIELAIIKNAGFRPVQPGPKMPIPMIATPIIAGFPSPAEDYIEEAVDLNELLIWNRAATFFGYIGPNSLSMLDLGFEPGNLIIIDRSIKPEHKNIVLAIVNGEHTLKQLMIGTDTDPHLPWLKASNPEYDNIYFRQGDMVTIFGVVTFNIKKVYQCRR